MRPDDLRPLSLFDGLTDAQLAEMLAGSEAVRIEPGEELFDEGAPAESWWVLVSGAIELVRRVGREQMVVARMDVAGRWAGGFRAWDGQGVYLATGRGHEPGEVLRVPAEVLRRCTDAWFPFGGHLIDGLFHTARSIESTARQHGALVTLGTLAAGLAHEINNPAAAASRSVAGLEAATGTVLSMLGTLARGEVSPFQYAALDELRSGLEVGQPETDPLALADREQEIATWLGRHGVGRAWALAPTLAARGADVAWCQRAAQDLDTALEPGLEFVAGTFAMDALLTELSEATRRISELVAAVRSYSQVDRAMTQRIDVTEGIESTLVVLGHKLRDGVTVVRDYEPGLPRMDAYPGELNQVWTNLVDNAVDAMDGAGTLRLSARGEDDHLVVEVADTGPGMPPEVAARAFEAFYTTKDVGKGTGLGLDIARRIVVERHGGTITVGSEPGGTVMRVRLPISRAV